MPEQTLKEDILNILRLLSADEELTQRDLSGHLGVSLGKTNYLLKSLVKKGFLKIKNFTNKNQKVGKVKYLLTKQGLKEKVNLTYHFLKRKESEYNHIKKEWKQLSVFTAGQYKAENNLKIERNYAQAK
ncbi:MAG: MarR family EPS-associated transcriptional regulator [Candidatus Omnitrophota bacterium]